MNLLIEGKRSAPRFMTFNRESHQRPPFERTHDLIFLLSDGGSADLLIVSQTKLGVLRPSIHASKNMHRKICAQD